MKRVYKRISRELFHNNFIPWEGYRYSENDIVRVRNETRIFFFLFEESKMKKIAYIKDITGCYGAYEYYVLKELL